MIKRPVANKLFRYDEFKINFLLTVYYRVSDPNE